jgi:DNA-binding NarL/FixJ family response regulator
VQRRGVDRFELDLPGEQLVVVSVPTATEILDMLSPAERDVAQDVLAGLSNAAIARKRGRAARTIANQLASIYRKLAIGSRAELAALMANA